MGFLRRLFGGAEPTAPTALVPQPADITCTNCGTIARFDAVVRASVLAMKDDEEASEMFVMLPWVDSDGHSVHTSLYSAPADRPVATVTSIVMDQIDSRPAAAQLGLEPPRVWSTIEVANVLRRLESSGYATYDSARDGWMWPVACPECQSRRLSGHLPRQPQPTSRVRDAIAPRRRFAIMQRDGFRCVYCGRTAAAGVVLHVDHVVPVAAGGTDDDGNLVTACDECNLGKGSDELP